MVAVCEHDRARQVLRRVGIEAFFEAVVNAIQLTPNRESGGARVLGRLQAKFDGEVRGTLSPVIDAVRNYHGGRAESFHFFE